LALELQFNLRDFLEEHDWNLLAARNGGDAVVEEEE